MSYLKHNIETLIANVFQEGKIFHQTTFFSVKLYIQHPGDICLSQDIIFLIYQQFPYYNFIATLCNNTWLHVKNITNVYVFRLRH